MTEDLTVEEHAVYVTLARYDKPTTLSGLAAEMDWDQNLVSAHLSNIYFKRDDVHREKSDRRYKPYVYWIDGSSNRRP